MEDLGQQPSCNQGLRMTTDQFCRFDRPYICFFFSLFIFYFKLSYLFYFFFFFTYIYINTRVYVFRVEWVVLLLSLIILISRDRVPFVFSFFFFFSSVKGSKNRPRWRINLFVTYDDDDYDDNYGRGVAFELVASIIVTLIDTSNSAFMGDYHDRRYIC